MSTYPQNRREMLDMSYKFKNTATCKDCNQPVEWWTTYSGRSMAFDRMFADADPSTPHFRTCPNKQPIGTLSGTLDDLVGKIRADRNARLVFVLSDHGSAVAFRDDISAEELHANCVAIGERILRQFRGGR